MSRRKQKQEKFSDSNAQNFRTASFTRFGCDKMKPEGLKTLE